MSATMKTNVSNEGRIAHLNFRVRCESLGHGEAVFLVKKDDANLTRVGACCKICTAASVGYRPPK